MSFTIPKDFNEEEKHSQSSQQQLLLTGTTSEQSESISSSLLIDALPYIDNDYNNNLIIKSEVDNLILEEMKNSKNSINKYYDDIKLLPSIKSLPNYQINYINTAERFSPLSNKYLTESWPQQPPKISSTHKNHPIINYNDSDEDNDSETHQKFSSVDSYSIAIEYCCNELLTNELTQKFSSSLSDARQKHLNSQLNLIQNNLQSVNESIVEINRKRKLLHVNTGKKLNELENEYQEITKRKKELQKIINNK